MHFRRLFLASTISLLLTSCTSEPNSKKAEVPPLPDTAQIKILSYEQLNFPEKGEPGRKLVLARFRVKFKDAHTGLIYTEEIRDVINSFPSGPLPVLENETMSYGQLHKWKSIKGSS